MALIVVSLSAVSSVCASVDWIRYDGGWEAVQLLDEDYVSIASNFSSVGTAYGAKPANGVDWIVWSGAWIGSPLIAAPRYTDLTGKVATNLGQIYGVNASGGIDLIAWSGGWVSTNLVSGNYVSVATKSTDDDSLFAARADGGIDYVSWSGGWGAACILTGTSYVDIAPDAYNNGFIWGARSDGGIDYISYDRNNGWCADTLMTGNYISVCATNGSGGELAYGGRGAYAARANGGIDWISFYEGAWVTTPIVSGGPVYGDICEDSREWGFLIGTTAVPEPCTLASLGVGLIGMLGILRKRK